MFKHSYPGSPQKLEELLAQSAIDASLFSLLSSLFLPFAIFRLRTYAVNHQVKLTISLYESDIAIPQVHNLQLCWDQSSDTLITPPTQPHIITEWAACGIALALIPIYTPYRVLEVARIGERFDYWLGHDVRDVGLEISGTMEGDLAARSKIKQRQLQRNPYKSAGYVCVVGFDKQQVRLSFYQDGGSQL